MPVNNMNKLEFAKKNIKLLLLIFAIFTVVLFVMFPKKKDKERGEEGLSPLPEQTVFETKQSSITSKLPYKTSFFSIDTPQRGIYSIYVNEPTEQSKKEALSWLEENNFNIDEENVRFISSTDENSIDKMLKILPYEEKSFDVYFSAKTTQFVVTIRSGSPSQKKQEVVKWFENNGVSDMSVIDVVWINETQ